MGFAGRVSRTFLVAIALAGAVPALAQFSDSYNFLKAVRDADGTKAMTYLNKPGAPVLNARDGSTGEGALHIVVKRHDETWLAVLLARGAQTEARDRDGNTPLLVATQLADVESARLLLQSGAKANATNTRGETPLIVAVQHRDLPSIRLLLAGGADPKIADTIAGKNARDYAAEDSRGTAIAKLLDDAKPKLPSNVAGPVR